MDKKEKLAFTWKDLIQGILSHKTLLIRAQVLAMLATSISIVLPLFMPMLVDEVLLNKPGQVLLFLNAWISPNWQKPWFYVLTLMVGTMVLRSMSVGLNIWQGWMFSNIAKDVIYKMRSRLLKNLRKTSMSEYETLGGGQVSSRLINDLGTVDEFLGVSLSKLMVSFMTVLGVAGVLLWLHWKLALFILLLNPVVLVFTKSLGKRVKDLKKKENAALEIFQQALTETLDSLQQIRAGNRQQSFFDSLLNKAEDIKTTAVSYSWKSNMASRGSFLVFLLGFDVFPGMAMLAVVYSNLSVGQMMAVFTYLWVMMGPIQELLNMQFKYYAAQGALGRLNSLMQLQQEPVYSRLKNPFENKKTVGLSIDKVCFSYTEETRVLNNLSLRISPGEKVALVGASGGGKSTLVQMLLGLYPASSGHIYFDGVPLEEIGLDVVRENMTAVLQHPAMLNTSIRYNLSMGDVVEERQLWEALDQAQISDFVREQPEGLDTIIGRQGLRLSGGQRQRIAIARMILSDPKVIVLDEATSALDNETEARVHEALSRFLEGRTTLIIAHRLNAVLQADKAYVFEDGRIAEHGSHQELLKNEGLYAKLYGQVAEV